MISTRNGWNVPAGLRNFHVGRGIETITSRYLCRCIPKLNVVAIFSNRGRRMTFCSAASGAAMVDSFRWERIPLHNGAGQIPVLGFGTLIADPEATRIATGDALEAGFRHFDCAERYRNEREVGEALRTGLAGGNIGRDDLFVTTKVWNTNHRPERVLPAFDGSLERLGLDYLDLYLIHTPFAFKPGDDQDPRDENGDVIYDEETTLVDTWRAMEKLVDGGRCRAIGLSDVDLGKLMLIDEAARIKPAVIQVEAHPYLPESELLRFCRENAIVLLAFARLGHGMKPGPIEDPVILSIAERTGKTPAQVLLAWAAQRGTALLTTPKSPARDREFRRLPPSRGRDGCDRFDRDRAEVQPRCRDRQSRLHSARQLTAKPEIGFYRSIFSSSKRRAS
jgi:alcohol dehydrogenase (NADP+)